MSKYKAHWMMVSEDGECWRRRVRKGISNIKCLLNKDRKEVKKGAMRMTGGKNSR